MTFDTVAIVGVGLIGGSIGMALKQRRLAHRVIGVGRRAAALRQARKVGAIDVGSVQLRRGVADAELTIFCTPVDLIAEQAREAAEYCPSRAILTDSGSTKAGIVARLEPGLPDEVKFVGSHPLAGSEKRGVAVARPDLFNDRVCVVTPTNQTSATALAQVKQFWQALGASVLTMSPEAHDRALAYSSHLPHLVAAALSVVLPEKYNNVAAAGFRDTTRIAASDPLLWTAIFLENAEPLLDSLSEYEGTLQTLRAALEKRDRGRLRQFWKLSQAKRQRLARRERNNEDR